MVSLQQLRRSSVAELEAIYAEPQPAAVPVGCFRGHHLVRLDGPGARRPLFLGSVGFQFVPFGIDFDRRCWWFGGPAARVGRFLVQPGPSRWRPAPTLQLHYSVSRLPRFVRRLLYDEVKPLTDELCLGIGGIHDDAGRGDHFFFALTRL